MAYVEPQAPNSDQHLDEMLHEILSIDPSGLLAMVPGSSLHDRASRNGTDGADEG